MAQVSSGVMIAGMALAGVAVALVWSSTAKADEPAPKPPRGPTRPGTITVPVRPSDPGADVPAVDCEAELPLFEAVGLDPNAYDDQSLYDALDVFSACGREDLYEAVLREIEEREAGLDTPPDAEDFCDAARVQWVPVAQNAKAYDDMTLEAGLSALRQCGLSTEAAQIEYELWQRDEGLVPGPR